MKTCKKCGIIKKECEFETEKRVKSGIGANCKECHKEYMRKIAIKYYKDNPDRFLGKNRNWAKKNPVKYRQSYINRRRKIRNKVWELLGGNNPKCNCCGETEEKFFSIDHINGGGLKEKRENRLTSSESVYRYVLNSINPKIKYQILCFNCNLAKGFNGSCPHKIK